MNKICWLVCALALPLFASAQEAPPPAPAAAAETAPARPGPADLEKRVRRMEDQLEGRAGTLRYDDLSRRVQELERKMDRIEADLRRMDSRLSAAERRR